MSARNKLGCCYWMMDRRDFLKYSVKNATIAAVACMVPGYLLAAVRPSSASKQLSLYNPHTAESLRITYAEAGEYLPDALGEIDRILRDYRTDEVKAIDPALLDFLYAISNRMGLTGRNSLHIISGYRSPETNARLRRKSRRVAKNSYHIKGQAVDFCVPRYRLSHLRKVALSLRAGGVGYYPRSHFLHVDVGDFRYW